MKINKYDDLKNSSFVISHSLYAFFLSLHWDLNKLYSILQISWIPYNNQSIY